MKTQVTYSLDQLENNLRTHVRSSHNRPTVIIGGHYPLERDFKPGVESDDSFGYFPKYTMDLACRLVKEGKKNGTDTKLALLVDDHSQQTDPYWYNEKLVVGPDTIRKKIENYFRTFKLPEKYKDMLNKNGLTEKDIVSSKYHPLVFPETEYRKEFSKKTGLDPGCAGETKLILEELAKKGFKKTIGLIPARCQGPTCAAVNFYNKEKLPKMKTVFAYLSTKNYPFREDDETPEGLIKRTVEDHEGVRIAAFG